MMFSLNVNLINLLLSYKLDWQLLYSLKAL